MLFESEAISSYLEGDSFDSSLKVQISKRFSFPLKTRDEQILDLAAGKRVLHVGFADHEGLSDAKEAAGSWLHAKLQSVTSELWGLDTNKQQIASYSEKGFSNLFSWEDLDTSKEFDIVLVPDVIEHVENVGQFLQSLHGLRSSEFVFTTPNAYSFEMRKRFRAEIVNSDHVSIFSPYTLNLALRRAGFEVSSLLLSDIVGLKRPIAMALKYTFPLLRENLVVIARKTAGIAL